MPSPEQKRKICFRARTTLKMELQPANFGETQHMKPINFSRRSLVQKLDRERSGKEVERLLCLRRQSLTHARQVGDKDEVTRLENLGLFDSVLPSTNVKSQQHCHSNKTNNEKLLLKPLPGLPPISDTSSDRSEADTVSRSDSDSNVSSNTSTNSHTLFQSIDATPLVPKTPAPSPTYSMFPRHLLASYPVTSETFDPFLDLVYSSQKPETKARHLRRQQKRQILREQGSPPASASPSSSTRSSSSPSPETLQARIISLSQSPILKQLVKDLDLLHEYEIGICEPGEPEVELIRARVGVLEQSEIVRELEGCLRAIGGTENKE